MTYTPHVWSRHDKLDSLALNGLEQAVGAFSGTADEATAAAATANTAAANAAQSAQAAAASAALVGAPAGSAIDAHVGPSLMLPGSGDQTSALTSFLAAPSPLGVKKIIGAASISATVPIPAGVYVDTSQATITQTASSTVSFTLAASATLTGGTLAGKGTDYVPGTNINPSAIGVKVTGAGAAIRNATILNHAGAGIQVSTGATGFTCSNTEISAPSLSIPAGDSACFGVYITSGCASPTFTDVHIHDTSMGFIASVDTTHLMFQGGRIHDIKGQHGLYLQNAVGLHVENVGIWNTGLNGLKCQMFASNTADGMGAVIANVTVDNAGDVGLTMNNTDAALTRKYRALTMSNVTVTNSVRGFYLGSIRTATLDNLVAYNCSGDGVTMLDCWDVEGRINLDTIGQVGLRLTSVSNGSNQRITIGGRIRNAANGNVASNLYGVYYADGSDITLDGLRVSATNGFMQYGVFVAGGDQKTLTLRRCDLSGDTGTSVRLLAGPVRVKEWSNNTLSGNVLNFPTAFATRIGSGGQTTDYVINALPTTDVFRSGDKLRNGAPAVGSPKEWICTTAGGAHGGTWAASTAYNVGDWRRNSAGRVYSCTVGGTSGSTGPVGTTIGATETDGGVTWQCQALAPAVFTSTGNL